MGANGTVTPIRSLYGVDNQLLVWKTTLDGSVRGIQSKKVHRSWPQASTSVWTPPDSHQKFPAKKGGQIEWVMAAGSYKWSRHGDTLRKDSRPQVLKLFEWRPHFIEAKWPAAQIHFGLCCRLWFLAETQFITFHWIRLRKIISVEDAKTLIVVSHKLPILMYAAMDCFSVPTKNTKYTITHIFMGYVRYYNLLYCYNFKTPIKNENWFPKIPTAPPHGVVIHGFGTHDLARGQGRSGHHLTAAISRLISRWSWSNHVVSKRQWGPPTLSNV